MFSRAFTFKNKKKYAFEGRGPDKMNSGRGPTMPPHSYASVKGLGLMLKLSEKHTCHVSGSGDALCRSVGAILLSTYTRLPMLKQ